LIGLERGWRRRGATAGSRAAGIRTFALSGLLGGVIAALALAVPKQEAGGAATLAIVLGVAFAAYSAVIALFTRAENQAAGHFSATTAIAGMLTFALGAYALLGDMRVAAGAAVAATAMRAAPPPAKARRGCWRPASRWHRRSCSCASSASWPRSRSNSSYWSRPRSSRPR